MDVMETSTSKDGLRQKIIDKSTTLSVISALLLSIYMPMMYQIQQFPDVYGSDSVTNGTSGAGPGAQTSDRSSMSTPKYLFLVGWIIGNTGSFYALVSAFMQLLAYTETNDDDEAFEMSKQYPASRSAYLFFLGALVLGCLFMVYSYLWVVGHWKGVLMSGIIVSGAGTIFLYDVTSQVAILLKLKHARVLADTQQNSEMPAIASHCNANAAAGPGTAF